MAKKQTSLLSLWSAASTQEPVEESVEESRTSQIDNVMMNEDIDQVDQDTVVSEISGCF